MHYYSILNNQKAYKAMNITREWLFMQKDRLSFLWQDKAFHEHTIFTAAGDLLRRRAANLGILQFLRHARAAHSLSHQSAQV
jgi:hypothetical protein